MGIVIPRQRWPLTKTRSELAQAGVYILVGWEDEDRPTIYIGEGDSVGHRIESHYKKKMFWDRAIIFTAGNRLNKAYVKWLEYALVQRAKEAARCTVGNDNEPRSPALSESERAAVEVFLDEVLQILPIVGVHAFEMPRPVATNPLNVGTSSGAGNQDTIVVPAQLDGFEKTFLGEHCWYAVRIAGGRLNGIKYIAGYQTNPISAITHYAQVARIEPYGDGGKYKLVFAGEPMAIGPIPMGEAPKGAMQSPRYTSFLKLQQAHTLVDLF